MAISQMWRSPRCGDLPDVVMAQIGWLGPSLLYGLPILRDSLVVSQSGFGEYKYRWISINNSGMHSIRRVFGWDDRV